MPGLSLALNLGPHLLGARDKPRVLLCSLHPGLHGVPYLVCDGVAGELCDERPLRVQCFIDPDAKRLESLLFFFCRLLWLLFHSYFLLVVTCCLLCAAHAACQAAGGGLAVGVGGAEWMRWSA